MADEKKRGGRILRFAVSGALLVSGPTALAACGGGEEPHANEPVPTHTNEPVQETVTNEPGEETGTVNEPEPEEHVNEPEPEDEPEGPHVNEPAPD